MSSTSTATTTPTRKNVCRKHSALMLSKHGTKTFSKNIKSASTHSFGTTVGTISTRSGAFTAASRTDSQNSMSKPASKVREWARGSDRSAATVRPRPNASASGIKTTRIIKSATLSFPTKNTLTHSSGAVRKWLTITICATSSSTVSVQFPSPTVPLPKKTQKESLKSKKRFVKTRRYLPQHDGRHLGFSVLVSYRRFRVTSGRRPRTNGRRRHARKMDYLPR